MYVCTKTNENTYVLLRVVQDKLNIIQGVKVYVLGLWACVTEDRNNFLLTLNHGFAFFANQ